MVYAWTEYSFKGNTDQGIPTYLYLLQMMIGKSYVRFTSEFPYM